MNVIRWLFMRPALLVALLAAISIMLNEYVMRTNIAHAGDYSKQEQHTEKDEYASKKQEDHTDSGIEAGTETEKTAQDTSGNTAKEQVAEPQEASTAGVVSVASADQAAQKLKQTTQSAVKQEQVAVTGKAPGTPNSGDAANLLKQARTAFWAGDLDKAVGLYQSLVNQTYDPAHKHELANVYSKQKNAEQAIPLYVELAPWLAENDQVDTLQEIHAYISKRSPEQAEKIVQFLESKQ